jgi:hypothetical protein
VSWQGNDALRPFLAPLDRLKADKGNPRRGDVPAIMESLTRFGQQRPVLATPGGVIVAGNHTAQAARELGWDQIAVVRTALRGREQRAYGLADNRTGDLGTYDDAILTRLLDSLPSLDGTGYTDEDKELMHALASLGHAEPTAADLAGTPFRKILRYDRAAYEEVIAGLDAVLDATGLDSYSEAVARVVTDAHAAR